MTSHEFNQKSLRDDIQRILKSPSEIERWLSVIDFVISTCNRPTHWWRASDPRPDLRDYAVDLLTETAARADAVSIAVRLLEAADAMRAGKPSASKPFTLPQQKALQQREQPPIQELNLEGVELNDQEFARVMRERKAVRDPGAEGYTINGGGYVCWFASDGRIAGWEEYRYQGRGEYYFPNYAVEPWGDEIVLPTRVP